MIEILPAILAKSYDDLEDKLALMAGRVPLVHVDVLDATLTPNTAWPYSNESSEWKNIQNEEAAMPCWEELNFEAHLMTKDVAVKYEEWVRAGVERLVVHYEAFDTSEVLSSFLTMLRTHFSPKEGGGVGIEIGLAANLETSADLILPHVLEVDFVHLMAVTNLGKQGEVFDESIFDKIEKIKYVHPDTIISVDGGVTTNNIKRLADAGVSRVCVGSAIFAASDPGYALEELQSVL